MLLKDICDNGNIFNKIFQNLQMPLHCFDVGVISYVAQIPPRSVDLFFANLFRLCRNLFGDQRVYSGPEVSFEKSKETKKEYNDNFFF